MLFIILVFYNNNYFTDHFFQGLKAKTRLKIISDVPGQSALNATNYFVMLSPGNLSLECHQLSVSA